jgi:lactate permease
MTLGVAIAPIALLVLLVTCPWPRRWMPVPAHFALLLAAVLAYGLQWLHAAPPTPSFGRVRVHAAAIDGALTALKPLAIVFGAVVLFKTMQASGAESALASRLRSLSPDPVAQLVLIGWAFSFLVEGLSGFGTPAALAAPILVGLGFPALRVAAMCLIMNSVPVAFGAVGTPIWFGLEGVGLSDEDLRVTAFKAASINAAAALVIPVLALLVVLPWRKVRPRLMFVALVIVATIGPYLLVARWSFEFPSIVGGMTGLLAAVAAARLGFGLPHEGMNGGHVTVRGAQVAAVPADLGLVRAAAPLIAVVALLALTRIDQLGVRDVLTRAPPNVSVAAVSLGSVGEAWISPALVVGLRRILGTDASWSMPLLFVPFIVPFLVVSLGAIPLLKMSRAAVSEVWGDSVRRLAHPAMALIGAMVLAEMLTLGGGEGANSPAKVIGSAMADMAGPAWPIFAALLGALGTFFSGSCTVSNLTFAPVQTAVSNSLDLNVTTTLALQTVGGAMGAMVSIQNIVAVATVLGLSDRRAVKPTSGPGALAPPLHDTAPRDRFVLSVLKLTVLPMLAYAAVAALAGATWMLLDP